MHKSAMLSLTRVHGDNGGLSIETTERITILAAAAAHPGPIPVHKCDNVYCDRPVTRRSGGR